MKHITLFFGLIAQAAFCAAIEMPQSGKDMGCQNCHMIDRKIVGPAWMDVSNRYRDKRNDPATLELLVKKVSRGGEGNWGNLPMVANDPSGTKRDKIVDLVKFILALSDQLPENQGKK